jgi:hypothetical protein
VLYNDSDVRPKEFHFVVSGIDAKQWRKRLIDF